MRELVAPMEKSVSWRKLAVRNQEGSDVSPYLQDSKLAYQSCGCWQKTQNSWVRDKQLYYPQHSKQFERVCIGSSCSLSLKQVTQKGPDGCCVYSKLVSQLKIFRLQEPKSFIKGSNCACPLLWKKTLPLLYWTVNKRAFCSGGRHYLARLFT